MTSSYKLIFSKQVRKKDIPRLSAKDRKRVLKAIDMLQHEPRPKSAKRLTNREEYRIRQGDYRILYVIEDEIRIVEIRRVGHRGSVYEEG